MDLKKILIGKNPPIDVTVIIEIPLGSNRIKYEVDKGSGALFAVSFIRTEMVYPANDGFVAPSNPYPFYDEVQARTDPPPMLLQKTGHFFVHCKGLNLGKWVKVAGWGDTKVAAGLFSQRIDCPQNLKNKSKP
jgi:inorganic pyrophosphatase